MSNSGPGWREGSGGGTVQSVDRAVAILEILARDGEAGVTEVARELGVHKSTASRLLAALDRGELVAQDAARGKFRLGVGLVRLGGAAGRRLDVVQASRPVGRALAAEVGETVNLAILAGRDAVDLCTSSSRATSVTPASPSRARISRMATARSTDCTGPDPEDPEAPEAPGMSSRPVTPAPCSAHCCS